MGDEGQEPVKGREFRAMRQSVLLQERRRDAQNLQRGQVLCEITEECIGEMKSEVDFDGERAKLGEGRCR